MFDQKGYNETYHLVKSWKFPFKTPFQTPLKTVLSRAELDRNNLNNYDNVYGPFCRRATQVDSQNPSFINDINAAYAYGHCAASAL